jgi:transcriptional regulator with GAF, ATPase, and Fis domain
MRPRVICVSGPLEGQEFELTQGGLTFGRNGANDVNLGDSSVSRRHCAIQISGAEFVLSDHGSHNHTWVNGVKVHEHVLRSGDRISIGTSTFQYIAAGESFDVEAPQEPASISETLILRRDDAVLLRPHAILDSAPTNPESFRALGLLLDAVQAMSTGGSLEVSAARLLDLIGAVLPVTSAGLHLEDEGENACFWWPTPGSPLPKAILRRVVDDRVSICTSDILTDGVVDPTNSIVSLPSRAVIAVPVVTEDRVVGVLHGSAKTASFDADHLQLLTGIAGVAASPLAAALRVQKLENENVRLRMRVRTEANLIGSTPKMEALHGAIAKVAPTSSTVLIIGESGTGKELVATAIHRHSPRAGKTFLAINCAALTETLLESELFGHEKGAFTGATGQRRGKFEEAHGGTLFLDEVGELAPAIQAKLLRVLQERTLTRVGGHQAIPVDVRVIAATNRDLREMVRSGTFRQDLYFRLNVISIQTPPLRERRGDIPELVPYFVRKHSACASRRVTGVSPAALKILTRYDWPGNVRELENVIERAMVLGSTETIVPEDLPDTLHESGAGEETATNFHDEVNRAKRAIILGALEKNHGSYTEAARQLGIHPNNLHRLIRSLQIQIRGK